MTALLQGLAFAAVFVAGLYARSIWQHERDLARRVLAPFADPPLGTIAVTPADRTIEEAAR